MAVGSSSVLFALSAAVAAAGCIGGGDTSAGGSDGATEDADAEAWSTRRALSGPGEGGGDVELSTRAADGAAEAEAAADGGVDATEDAGPLVYLDAGPACAPDGGHGGSRWQDLYACYFGPSGVAGCGTMADCHGSASDDGALSSGGFVCSPTDVTACWQSAIASIVPEGGAPDPTSTLLYVSLRKSDGTGSMPLVPMSLVFQTGDMARIAAWVTSGAANN